MKHVLHSHKTDLPHLQPALASLALLLSVFARGCGEHGVASCMPDFVYTYRPLAMLGCHMQSEGLMHPLSKVEMPLVRVLANMEHIRMAINVHILENQK